jgi:pyruvate kinase
MRRAKIVATIGPSSQNPVILKQMIQAGMDVARLNFSHGSHQEYREVIRHLRALSSDLGKPVTILQDLQGPKFRVGTLHNGRLELIAGHVVRLVNPANHPGGYYADNLPEIPMPIPDPQINLTPGKSVLLDDGRIELKIIANEKMATTAEVISGGILLPGKGINLPGVIKTACHLLLQNWRNLTQSKTWMRFWISLTG